MFFQHTWHHSSFPFLLYQPVAGIYSYPWMCHGPWHQIIRYLRSIRSYVNLRVLPWVVPSTMPQALLLCKICGNIHSKYLKKNTKPKQKTNQPKHTKRKKPNKHHHQTITYKSLSALVYQLQINTSKHWECASTMFMFLCIKGSNSLARYFSSFH